LAEDVAGEKRRKPALAPSVAEGYQAERFVWSNPNGLSRQWAPGVQNRNRYCRCDNIKAAVRET